MTGSLESTLIPVLALVATGFVAGRSLQVDLAQLSRFTLYVLTTALIFDSMYRAELPAASAIGLVAGFAAVSAVLAALSWALARLQGLSPRHRASFVAAGIFPNSGNMGLSVVLFALGQAAMSRAVVYLVASSILMFGFGPALFRGGQPLRGLAQTLRLPFLWAAGAGFLLRWLGVGLPFGLGRAVHMTGQAAIPVVLVILGMQISRSRVRLGRFVLLASAVRLAGGPLLALAAAKLLHLSLLDTRVLVLQSAMPTAVNSLLLSIEFGGDAERTAETVVASSVLAFVSLPVVLGLLH